MLSKIISFQSKVEKALWLAIVFFSFLGAGHLISKSYTDWQSSPISTSISTHPLESLEFPTIAVCPPEKSNTALNLDLLRAFNRSFSDEERDSLVEAVWEHFVKEEHKSFAEDMVAATNPSRMYETYSGYQSVPISYNQGYEVKVWNTSGTIKSAWFGEEFEEGHFMKDKDIHIVLDFPTHIADLVGKGSLLIELEVDIRREEKGWTEQVQYSDGIGQKVDTSTSRLEYKKDQLNFSSFEVWYSFRTTSRSLISSWKEKRMTGFRMTWAILNEHAPVYMEMSTSKLGSRLTTPICAKESCEEFFKRNQNFAMSLPITQGLLTQIDDGLLVIEIQMNRIKEKSKNEDFFITEPGYTKRPNQNWEGAEGECQNLGGHLASAETDKEMESLFDLAQGDWVLLGGRKRVGTWRWSNGAEMTNMTKRNWERPPPGEHLDCTAVQNKLWYTQSCKDFRSSYICTIPMKSKITEKRTVSTLFRNYTRGQIGGVPFIRLDYKYDASTEEELSVEEKQRKPGFEVEGYVLSQNGTRIPIKETQNDTAVWRVVKNTPLDKDTLLLRMTETVVRKRAMNISRGEIIEEAIQKKIELLRSKALDNRICDGDKMNLSLMQTYDDEQSNMSSTRLVEKEDIEIGLTLYMIQAHCPKETMKLAQFVLQLTKEESLPMLILAIVNTLQSGQLSLSHRILLAKIYNVVDSFFGFHLGKILLATSSPAQVAAFQNQYLPYLNLTDELIQKCLTGPSCFIGLDHLQGKHI